MPVAAEWLRLGANVIELWADARAMVGWGLALEGGHADPASYVSDDTGQTWRSAHMGYLNNQRGEYVVRLRLAEGADPAPPPPPPVWEDPAHPRLADFRALLPAEARQPGPLLPRVRALSAWLSTRWEHTDSSRATQFTPWDAATILAWAARGAGHDGRRPVLMCVQYGVALVSACQALGLPARCAVFTSGLNNPEGHFAGEVWFEEWGKWVFVDPNSDVLFMRAGVPLTVGEIQAAGSDLGALAVWGAGARFQRGFAHMERFVTDNLLRGVFIQRRSVWYRSDFLTHPELTPPAHGATAYSETGLVWETADRERGFGMFPYFGDAAYFDAAPVT